VECPKPGDAAYFNGVCGSSSCTGYDPDCCITDSDCSAATNLAGADYYCEETINTCITCSKNLDYYCPSTNCYETGVGEGDPDCCNVSRGNADCPEGFECRLLNGETWLGRCVPSKLGSACRSSSDCGSGLTCLDGVCVLQEFVSVSPSDLSLNLGSVGKVTVVVSDPQMRADTYIMRVSGTYAQFAQFVQGKVVSFSLGPNEVKKFTLIVYAGKGGTGDITVSVVSTTRALETQKTITVDVGEITAQNVSAAPGIGIREAVAVLIIAGALAWSMKRL